MKTVKTPARKAFPQKKGRRSLIVLLASLFVLLGTWVYQTVSEVGPEGFVKGLLPTSGKQKPLATVRLREQPVYKVKKTQDILGVHVVRVISRQQPEEFLILDGLAPAMLNGIYGKNIDRFWANQMAGHLLKLRGHSEESGTPGGNPPSIEVQSVRTIATGQIKANQRSLPYWQVQVQFQLGNENYPRFYEAALVRYPQNTPSKTNRETLIIGYAAKQAFQKNLLADLIENLEATKAN